MQILIPSIEEIDICNKNKCNKNSTNINYLNKKFSKPWGYEYLTYQTEKIGIWILHINQNQKTSLHCHFKKDSMLIALSGSFRIDTYSGYHILNENENMYFPATAFHGIMSYSEIGVILEIEIYSNEITYSDKNDLLRIRDVYNRDKNTYEGSVIETSLSEEDAINFHTKNNFYFENTCVNIKKYNKALENNCKINSSSNCINVLLDGKVIANNILAPGALLHDLDQFQLIDTECTVMEIQNMYCNENRKIIHSKEHLIDLRSKYNCNTIGLTSGCFDILHKGHLNNLKLSKSKCDILFVCLSSDKQIRLLKGESRPINNIIDRTRMLSHIHFIDYIILYDETNIGTEQELDNIMNILKPDLWFKGNDYTEDKIRSKHPALKNICLLENIPNISSSIIINKLD